MEPSEPADAYQLILRFRRLHELDTLKFVFAGKRLKDDDTPEDVRRSTLCSGSSIANACRTVRDGGRRPNRYLPLPGESVNADNCLPELTLGPT